MAIRLTRVKNVDEIHLPDYSPELRQMEREVARHFAHRRDITRESIMDVYEYCVNEKARKQKEADEQTMREVMARMKQAIQKAH